MRRFAAQSPPTTRTFTSLSRIHGRLPAGRGGPRAIESSQRVTEVIIADDGHDRRGGGGQDVVADILSGPLLTL